MNRNLKELENSLNVKFREKGLLKQALIHRSYLNENPREELDHNERLEFLGDAVLELAVTEYLYIKYPNPEGELTSWRAALVNTQSLASVAEGLGLNNFLYLSKGEAKDTGRARQAILANTMEAIIGALYLDQGYSSAQSFIEKNILSKLQEIIDKKLYRDAKSLFQEAAQERVGVTPTYKVVSETGPDHAKNFIVSVYLNKESVAEGEGKSKQEAEQAAAQAALNKKGWE